LRHDVPVISRRASPARSSKEHLRVANPNR
jgi:hypothetical protein